MSDVPSFSARRLLAQTAWDKYRAITGPHLPDRATAMFAAGFTAGMTKQAELAEDDVLDRAEQQYERDAEDAIEAAQMERHFDDET